MPIRFWIDRHSFMVVARDGTRAVPTGPHHALVLAPGQRIDIVVQCSQDPAFRYKVFGMVAMREFYPGAHLHNVEASSLRDTAEMCLLIETTLEAGEMRSAVQPNATK